MLTSLLDRRVFAERVGTGTPRVLGLHGWARDRSDLLPALTGLDAFSLDLPGFGASPAPPEAWGSREYAELLRPLLADLERPRVLVGHSFGGRVAVQLAALAPDDVDGLVLTGTPLLRGPASPPPLGYRVVRRLARAGVLPQSVLEAQRRKRGSADYLAAQGVLRDVLVRVVNEDYREQLAALRCPLVLVQGEHDTAAPVDRARRAAGMAARAEVVVVPGSAHLLDAALSAEVRRAVDRVAA